MQLRYNEYTASLPELATAISIMINEMKLNPIIEVLDRGAVSGIIEFIVDDFNSAMSERAIRVFKATMRDNGFTVLEASWDGDLHVKIQRQLK